MARRGKSAIYSGRALEDGFTCLAKRPRTAAAGNFTDPELADAYDDTTDFLVELGGRSAARRRVRDLREDDEGY